MHLLSRARVISGKSFRVKIHGAALKKWNGFLEKPGNVSRTIPKNVRCRIFENIIGPEFFFTVIRKKLRQLIFAKIFR